LSTLFLAAILSLSPQSGSLQELERAVKQSRTVAIAPHATPPAWMEYERVQKGYTFFFQHAKSVTQVLGTSSLASTYAAQDVAPILMQTGRLPNDFNQRMKETEDQIRKLLLPGPGQDGFLKRNYTQAIALGQIHADVAGAVSGLLHWDPKVRIPMNGQSFAFVLYSFAWWPVEAMIATKEVDPEANAKQLNDWFHLWSVFGYGMGVPEALLPTNYARAKEIARLLTKAQYVKKGQKLPDGISILLGAHVRQLAGRAPQGGTVGAAKTLAGFIAYSPGLTEALGLGDDPAGRLVEYAGK
jgi:hypothetical protein